MQAVEVVAQDQQARPGQVVLAAAALAARKAREEVEVLAPQILVAVAVVQGKVLPEVLLAAMVVLESLLLKFPTLIPLRSLLV